jgi:hypothetical protein
MTSLAQSDDQYQHFKIGENEFWLGIDGSSYRTQSGLARLCEVTSSRINKWRGVSKIEPISARVLVSYGERGVSQLQNVKFYNEQMMVKALNEFKPDRAYLLSELGLRTLHQQAANWTETLPTFNKDEALAEKTEYVKSIFRPHFDKVDRFVKDQCSSINAELKTAKKIWVSEINPVARLANESDEDFEQRLDRIEILQDLDLPLFEKGEVDGIYIFEHGFDVLWDTWDLPEIFEAKVGGSIDGLNWSLKTRSATIFDLGWNADAIDSAMLSCFGTCLDLGGVVQAACREFDRLQPAKGAVAQLGFDDDSVLDNCARKCKIIPEFNAHTKKLEALKIPKQLALSGSASIEVDTKESAVSRLNFGIKLSELEWYRI